MMKDSARHHGELGDRRAKVKPGGQGKRKYSGEFVSLIRAELEIDNANSVARRYGLNKSWVYAVRDGILRKG